MEKTMRVSNMKSANGNKVANQFVIENGNTLTFQSYDSEILNVNVPNRTLVIHPDWNYSRTTAKYRNMFLADLGIQLSTKDIQLMLDFMRDCQTYSMEYLIHWLDGSSDMWTVTFTD